MGSFDPGNYMDKERLPLDRGGIRFPTNQLVPARHLPQKPQVYLRCRSLILSGRANWFRIV